MYLIYSIVCAIGLFLVGIGRANADLPCAARQIEGQSVVCVCNETYCDEITRVCAPLGQYVSYTSSKGGLRFYKEFGAFRSAAKNSECDVVLTLYPEEVFQTIEGFGGSVTDSAGINWRSLPPKMQRDLIYSYFGPKGLEYSLIRCPIGGCDFSTRRYSLDDLHEEDPSLCYFALADEDYLYKLPMLRMALAASCGRARVVASCWSPPAWMKTNGDLTGPSELKPEHFQTYADYHYRFIQSYTAEGVPIWACTTTNEPQNGITGVIPFNTLGWKPGPMAKWIAYCLGPTLRNSEFDVKILCSDDQRKTLPIYFNEVIEAEPTALDYIDGVAVHWYTNKNTPPSFYGFVYKHHPEKFIISTEACEGFITNDVDLGSWDRAMNYITDIIIDLNYNVVGWIDWNLCLDEKGGPNWVDNFVDSPIIVFKDKKEFVKQPMFYAMGHFSKWIPPGSVRINVEINNADDDVEQVAVRTPEETIVLVLHNKSKYPRTVAIVIGKKETIVRLEPYSIVTIEFPFNYAYFGVRCGVRRSLKEKVAYELLTDLESLWSALKYKTTSQCL